MSMCTFFKQFAYVLPGKADIASMCKLYKLFSNITVKAEIVSTSKLSKLVFLNTCTTIKGRKSEYV